MDIQQCLHTAVLVSDLAKAEAFYETILGLTKIERSLNYSGAWYQLGDYQLHLMVDDSATKELTNPEKWGRNPHLAITVADLNRAIATLTQHNCPFQMSSSGRSALFVCDPDGNVLEINQA
ncbi:MAG: VOC family protein [Cyanobacteriota bacterium]|nr:VOC family protein [Cyanobacteriota bacterium]